MSESSRLKMCEMDKVLHALYGSFWLHRCDKTNITCNVQSYGHTHIREHKQVQQFEIENSYNRLLRILFLVNILWYVTSLDSYLIPAQKNISDITHAAANSKGKKLVPEEGRGGKERRRKKN